MLNLVLLVLAIRFIQKWKNNKMSNKRIRGMKIYIGRPLFKENTFYIPDIKYQSK